MSKVRRIDFSPDEYISGVAGKMPAEHQAIYWMVCTRIYSDGAELTFDDDLVDLLARDCRLRRPKVRAILDGLVAKEKLQLNEGKLSQKRCAKELKRSGERIETARENGEKGGRPAKISKQNQSTDEPGGFFDEKLTTNYQPSTINHQPIVLGASGDAAMNGHQVNGTNGHHAEPVTGGQLTLLPKGPKPDRKKPRTAWPADFTLNSEMATYCRTKLPATRPQALFEEFQNYHTAQGSIFASWPAAWRTWVDNAAKRAAGVRR